MRKEKGARFSLLGYEYDENVIKPNVQRLVGMWMDVTLRVRVPEGD
ncbi:hypothetical protein [Thermococcus sp. JCM 11816]